MVPGIQLYSLAVEEMFEELPKKELKLETVVLLFDVCCCVDRRHLSPVFNPNPLFGFSFRRSTSHFGPIKFSHHLTLF